MANCKVVGIGAQESRGLKRGIVANIESTVLSIKRAIEEAELMADCKINAVTVSMGGNHISSMNSHWHCSDPSWGSFGA